MFDDPRTKARSFLESSGVVTELEDVLNALIYEKPDDLHGFLANYFLEHSKPPKISSITWRRLMGPSVEPAVHIDLKIELRNKIEQRSGMTIHLSSASLTKLAVKQLDALTNSNDLRNSLSNLDLFDQMAIDQALENFRSNHSVMMSKMATVEAEAANAEAVAEAAKQTATKRPNVSANASKAAAAAPPSKKGGAKEGQQIEILPDEPEPSFFAGHLLIPGISLTCRLISAEIQKLNLYRLLSTFSLHDLSMPLPIVPVLQSGPSFPGKQALVKYFMLIPTPNVINNEEWIHKLHGIVNFIRDSIAGTKGATLQSSFATNDGCLVLPMDKPEQGFDLLQNAIQSVCGTDQHWFDYAVQMGPYEVFDYTRGKYDVATGLPKSPDELVDTYVEWLDAYPRCVMLIDPFRYADKPALARLCNRVSNRCYITSTDLRRYQKSNIQEDIASLNCHLFSLDSAATISELIERTNELRQNDDVALGFFERNHQEVAQTYAADLAVAFGCRFIKLPGILSMGSQTTANVFQRLLTIRDDLEMNGANQFTTLKQHEFIQIGTSPENGEPERVDSPVNSKGKDKKKRA